MFLEASDDSLEVQSMWAGDWSGELAQTHLIFTATRGFLGVKS